MRRLRNPSLSRPRTSVPSALRHRSNPLGGEFARRNRLRSPPLRNRGAQLIRLARDGGRQRYGLQRPGAHPGEHFCYQVRAVRAGMSTTTYSEFSNIACTTAAPVAIVNFEAVFAGGAHTCALASVPGAAYCWGRGESGQLGVPAPPSTCLTDGGFFPCASSRSRLGVDSPLRSLPGAARTRAP